MNCPLCNKKLPLNAFVEIRVRDGKYHPSGRPKRVHFKCAKQHRLSYKIRKAAGLEKFDFWNDDWKSILNNSSYGREVWRIWNN